MKICFKLFAALTAAGFMAVAPGCEGSVPDPDGMKPGEGGETEIPDGINEDGNKNGWLVNWEVPHADVALPEDVAYSRTVSETEGNSYAYVCETNDAGRLKPYGEGMSAEKAVGKTIRPSLPGGSRLESRVHTAEGIR